MKLFEWNKEKNEWLKTFRGVSFEEVVECIKSEEQARVVDNPNQKKYPGQRVYVINIKDYYFVVPFVEDSEKVFLKTIFASRKITKEYRKEKEDI